MPEPYGPFNPDVAWALRQHLDAWAKVEANLPDPDQHYALFAHLNPQEVCEAVIPALDAMLDLYAGRRRPEEVTIAEQVIIDWVINEETGEVRDA